MANSCISPLRLKIKGVWTDVPCGLCSFCLMARAESWAFRLYKELEIAESAYFLTLTYDEKNVAVSNDCLTLKKEDIIKFHKRLRMRNSRMKGEMKGKLKYYTVGEYGSQSERPHYHSIMFNLKKEVVNDLQNIWNKGFVKVGSVTDSSIRYVTFYIINSKQKIYEGREKESSFISKGIGSAFEEDFANDYKNRGCTITAIGGKTVRVPRYYRDKVLTNIQRAIDRNELLNMAEERRRRFIEDLRGNGYSNPYVEETRRLINYHESLKNKFKKKKL